MKNSGSSSVTLLLLFLLSHLSPANSLCRSLSREIISLLRLQGGQSCLLMSQGKGLCSGGCPLHDQGHRVTFMPSSISPNATCHRRGRAAFVRPFRSQEGPECLQIELGCRSVLTWLKLSPREETGCFMGSWSCG